MNIVVQAFQPARVLSWAFAFVLVAQAFLPVVGQTFLSVHAPTHYFGSSLMNSASYKEALSTIPALTGLSNT